MDATATDHASSIPKRARLRILVVEDHEDSRELMVEVLRRMGDHTIADVETGEEGLQLLRAGVYDLIVTDLGLPGMSGLEMLDQATREGLIPGPEILVCTAYEALRPQVIARGGRYLPKPVEIAQLSNAVLRVMRASEGPGSNPGSKRSALDRGERAGTAKPAMVFEHSVSGYDFVRALLLAGYRLVGSRMGVAVVAKGEVELAVAQDDVLDEETIRALLEKAKVALPDMRALLNRLGSRDTWPEPGEVLPSVGGKR